MNAQGEVMAQCGEFVEDFVCFDTEAQRRKLFWWRQPRSPMRGSGAPAHLSRDGKTRRR